MSEHTIKIFWIVGIAIVGGFIFAYLSTSETVEATTSDLIPSHSPGALKQGQIDSFDDYGKLKTRVNYKDGLKDGVSYVYYRNGNVQLAMNYESGKREGVSKKYYENGQLYAETPYINDELTGIRKTYYRSGNIMAEAPYSHNLPGVGLREFTTDGNDKGLSQSLSYQVQGTTLILVAPEKCNRDIEFFIAELVDQRYLDDEDPENIRIGQQNGKASIDLNRFTPSYIRYKDLVCQCKTAQGNVYITKAKYKL